LELAEHLCGSGLEFWVSLCYFLCLFAYSACTLAGYLANFVPVTQVLFLIFVYEICFPFFPLIGFLKI